MSDTPEVNIFDTIPINLYDCIPRRGIYAWPMVYNFMLVTKCGSSSVILETNGTVSCNDKEPVGKWVLSGENQILHLRFQWNGDAEKLKNATFTKINGTTVWTSNNKDMYWCVLAEYVVASPRMVCNFMLVSKRPSSSVVLERNKKVSCNDKEPVGKWALKDENQTLDLCFPWNGDAERLHDVRFTKVNGTTVWTSNNNDERWCVLAEHDGFRYDF